MPFLTAIFSNSLLEALRLTASRNSSSRISNSKIPLRPLNPVPLHLQAAYKDARYGAGAFPVAERLADCVLSLPMHTELDEEQLAYITRCVLESAER